MKSRQPHLRLRPNWAAVCLGCLLAVVLIVTSAPALAGDGKMKIVILSASPREPKAGQPFKVTFQIKRGSNPPMPLTDVKCLAQIGGRAAKVLEEGTDGTTGRCSWDIPSGAKGKSLGGIIAALRGDTGVWYYAGFDLPIK
jgi:hypothetical protein